MTTETKNTKAFYNNEIPEDWEICELGKLISLISGMHLNPEDYNNKGEGIPYFTGPTDFTNKLSNVKKWTIEKDAHAKNNDVLLTVKGSGVGGLFMLSLNKAAIGRQIMALRVNENNHSRFIYYSLATKEYNFQELAKGNMIPGLTRSDILSTKILTPPLPEQRAIARVLSTWDEAISKTQALITQKELRKKWLMQQLLTGKKRLKGFGKSTGYHKTDLGLAMPVDWTIVKVKDIFNERKETSKDQLAYPLFSLTIENGLTEKTDRYERSFLLKNKEENLYKLIHPNDILFNPMNLRFGAIAKSKIDQVVSVSAYYNSIYLKEINADIDYYEALFKTPVFINLYDRIAIGSLIEKKRVHLSNFIELEIPFPSKAEQTAIAQVLQAADKEISLLKAKAEKLREQKKGLMQVLLTGKQRLNQDLQDSGMNRIEDIEIKNQANPKME